MNIKINKAEEKLITKLLTEYQQTNAAKPSEWNTSTSVLNKIAEAGLIPTQRQPKQLKIKQYMFTFEEGGWNTCYGKSKRGAIKKAMAEYKDSKGLTPRPDSFHIATESGLNSALSLFY